MAHANENFAHLQAGYLFPEVARRISAWSERNPGEKVLRLSIGNTTEAIPPSIAQAMKDKIDALSHRDTYTGYGDEQGDIRLREALRNHYRNEYGVDLPADAFFVSDGNTGLEERILSEVNKLGIGPGGLGGDNTALAVSVLSEPTHIAGLPVAMTVNCWAERKCCLVFKEGEL